MQDQVLELINRVESDLDWLDQNMPDLKKEYDQKFIAIKNKRVIAVGNFIEDVIKNLNLQNIDPSETLIYFISKLALVL